MMADEMIQANSIKLQLTEAQAAERVAKRMRAYVRMGSQSVPAEELRGLLGPQADALRQAEVARVMAQPGRGKPMVAKPGALPKEIRTPEDQRRYNRQRDAEADRIWRAKQDR
jgi:hypothetical protein